MSVLCKHALPPKGGPSLSNMDGDTDLDFISAHLGVVLVRFVLYPLEKLLQSLTILCSALHFHIPQSTCILCVQFPETLHPTVIYLPLVSLPLQEK